MSLKKNDKRVKKFLDVIRCYVAVIWVLQVEDCLRKTQTSIYAIMRRKKKSRSMVMLRQIVWLINFMNESVGIFVQASNRRQPASWHNIILGKYITQNRFCIHSFIAAWRIVRSFVDRILLSLSTGTVRWRFAESSNFCLFYISIGRVFWNTFKWKGTHKCSLSFIAYLFEMR